MRGGGEGLRNNLICTHLDSDRAYRRGEASRSRSQDRDAEPGVLHSHLSGQHASCVSFFRMEERCLKS